MVRKCKPKTIQQRAEGYARKARADLTDGSDPSFWIILAYKAGHRVGVHTEKKRSSQHTIDVIRKS